MHHRSSLGVLAVVLIATLGFSMLPPRTSQAASTRAPSLAAQLDTYL